jgi:hypothetical protein
LTSVIDLLALNFTKQIGGSYFSKVTKVEGVYFVVNYPSTFVTCGDRRFKCGDRPLLRMDFFR